MKLIGIGGTNAAGKDSVREMLAERYGWMTFSGSDLLREEARKRGLSTEREVLRTISSEWRLKYGPGVIIDRAVDSYKKSKKKYLGLEVGSLRNRGEAERVHELGGVVVWVDAEPKIRHERISRRNRGVEDQKTFEEFMTEEEHEMHVDDNDHTLSMRGVKEKADIFLENNGDDIEKFKDEAEKALSHLL